MTEGRLCTSIDELRVGMLVRYTTMTLQLGVVGLVGPFVGRLKRNVNGFWTVPGALLGLDADDIAAGRVRILDEAGVEPPKETARRVRWCDEFATFYFSNNTVTRISAPVGLSSAAAARERVEHAEERIKGMAEKPRTPQVGEWYERVVGPDVARVGMTENGRAWMHLPGHDSPTYITPLDQFDNYWRGPVPAPEAAREVEKPAVQEEASCWDCNAVGLFPKRVHRKTRNLKPTCDACWVVREEQLAALQDKADTVTDANGKPIGRRIDLERPPRPRTVTSMPSGILTGYQGGGWNRRGT